jgi:hypothetical protein
MVLSRREGLVRDRTYQVRLYDLEDLKLSLGEVGFARTRVIQGREPQSRPGERGALSRRLALAAWKE